MVRHPHLEKVCLSCVNFRPQNTETGICRLDKSLNPDYPVKGHGENCEEWKTCGQQYYIRIGWVKKQKEKSAH